MRWVSVAETNAQSCHTPGMRQPYHYSASHVVRNFVAKHFDWFARQIVNHFAELSAYPANLCPLSCGVEFADL